MAGSAKLFPHYKHNWQDGACTICEEGQCDETIRDFRTGEKRRCQKAVIDADRDLYRNRKVDPKKCWCHQPAQP